MSARCCDKPATTSCLSPSPIVGNRERRERELPRSARADESSRRRRGAVAQGLGDLAAPGGRRRAIAVDGSRRTCHRRDHLGQQHRGRRLVRLLDSGIGLAIRLDVSYERGITALMCLMDKVSETAARPARCQRHPPFWTARVTSRHSSTGSGWSGRDARAAGRRGDAKGGEQAAAARVPLISVRKGVDKISMTTAYEAGGTVVGVAELSRASDRCSGESSSDARRPFVPLYAVPARCGVHRWNRNGSQQDHLRVSPVTLVVASAKGEGGTWSGATSSRRATAESLSGWAWWWSRNAPLVRSGGVAVEQPEQILDLGTD